MPQTDADAKVILLVEDNLHNRRIFSGILRHYGYEVQEAVNGERLWRWLAASSPT